MPGLPWSWLQPVQTARCWDCSTVLGCSKCPVPASDELTLSPRADIAAAEGPRKRMPEAVLLSASGRSGTSEAWPLQAGRRS